MSVGKIRIRCLSVFAGDADALNDHNSPHSGENAMNVILLEVFYIRDAGNVAEPEVLDHLVHGGALVRRICWTGVGNWPK